MKCHVVSLNLAVAATQNYILEQYHKQDLQFEKAFYDDVRDTYESILNRVVCFKLIRNHKYKEKRMEQWKAYVARTSKYPLLMVRNSIEGKNDGDFGFLCRQRKIIKIKRFINLDPKKKIIQVIIRFII
jgi:hypothetical protein